jgi:hypothetical protein
MRKRLVPFLALTIALACLVVATDASAVCARCSYGQKKCVDVNYPWADYCEWIPEEQDCYLEGECLARMAASKMALSAEYTVASVERIDEPAPVANATLVAALK